MSSSWCLVLVAALAAAVQGRAMLEDAVIVVRADGHLVPQLNATRYDLHDDGQTKTLGENVTAPDVVIPGQGTVRGTVSTSDQLKRPIFSYLGVPFAEAPVGALRFVAPVPKEPWDGILDASAPGKACIQTDAASVLGSRRRRTVRSVDADRQSEDCLILDVHTPQVNASAMLPVLVFVHGGSFLTGYSGLKTPQGLLDHDMVLVSPQYRLGPLGFLNLQTDGVPGNAGLLDLVEALRWVNKNIANFGGDPTRVTLGGHSAGAASASLLYLSPLTKGLIRGVLPMSGSALAFWSYDRAPEQAGNLISQAALCGGSSTALEQRVECLKQVPAKRLVQAYAIYTVTSLIGGSLGMSGSTPSVQKAGAVKVLPDTPENILSSPNFTALPYMTGCTKHEGTFPLEIAESGYLRPNRLMGNASFVRNDLIHVLLKVIGVDDPAGFVADSTLEAFMDLSTLGDYTAMKDGLIDLAGAFGFKSPARRIVERNADLGQPSYLYAYNHNGALTQNAPEGIYHGADQPYVFPDGTLPMVGDDARVAVDLRKLVANFVIYQNPTPTMSPVASTPTWPTYSRDSERYLEVVWPPATRQWYRSQLTVARRDQFTEGGTTTTRADGAVTKRQPNGDGGDPNAASAPALAVPVAILAVIVQAWRSGSCS